MEHTSQISLWSQTQHIILNHFCNSTIEFAWKENTPVATSSLSYGILFQCILININVLQKNDGDFHDKYSVTMQMLNINVRTLIKQRLSTSRSLLLVSDSIFPSKFGTHFPLQRPTSFFGTKDPTKYLTAVLLTTFEISAPHFRYDPDWFVNLDFTSVALLFVSLNDNFLRIGYIASGFDKYDSDKFFILLQPFPNGLSSFN